MSKSKRFKRYKYTKILTLPVILILSAILITVFYFNNRHPSQQPTQTSSQNGTLVKIPKVSQWVPYNPTCNNLKDTVQIYYPKDWYPVEYPEVTDSVGEFSKYECQAIFGYGAKQIYRQSISPNVLAHIKVLTWSNNQTVQQYAESLSKQDSPKVSLSYETINNQKYIKLNYGDHYDYVTQKGNRIFYISLLTRLNVFVDSKGNVSQIMLDPSFETINKEFMTKLTLF